MAQETILQHWLITKFALPFLLMFVLVFAILEKTKVLGDNKQVNAIIAFVIGLIFVGVAYPKDVVANMILFLTVSLVIVFVALILWGFAGGISTEKDMFTGKMKWVVGGVVLFAVTIAVLFSTGIENQVFDFLFGQSWSESFWTNFLFIGMVAVALAAILFGGKK